MTGSPKKVNVRFHAGYKGEETPRSVVCDQIEYPIEKILERKRVLNHKTGTGREEFTIVINEKKAVLKKYASGECELTYLSSK